MRPDGYLKTAWIMTVLFSIILPLHSQTPRQFSIELKDKPLPAALKLIEKEGGKNIIFSYNETGKRLRDSILSPIFHSYIFAMYKNESLWI